MKRKRIAVAVDTRQFKNSSHREKVVEHVFLGELLRYLWVKRIAGVQVLKPEVDAAGYDIVLSLGRVIRHVQLKTMIKGGKARFQPVHDSLAVHPSGCVVWIVLNEDLSIDHFMWFGGEPGQVLPDLESFERARHTRANAQGEKKERAQTWSVPKSKFERVADLGGLVGRLFGSGVGESAASPMPGPMNPTAYATLFRELGFQRWEHRKKLRHKSLDVTLYFNCRRDGFVWFTAYSRDRAQFADAFWQSVPAPQKKDARPDLCTLVPRPGRERAAFEDLLRVG